MILIHDVPTVVTLFCCSHASCFLTLQSQSHWSIIDILLYIDQWLKLVLQPLQHNPYQKVVYFKFILLSILK